MVLSTTVPKDFTFSTDTRVRASRSSSSNKEVDFTSQLRKPSSPVRSSDTVRIHPGPEVSSCPVL